MEKRLAFGAVFLLGTLAAAVGWLCSVGGVSQWLQTLLTPNQATLLTICGHGLQILGVIGAMLVPEGQQEEWQEKVYIDE